VAQVVGGSDFDAVWDDKANRCLLLLREADLWATRGRTALDPERVLAAFLQVLARPGSGKQWWLTGWRWPLRFFADLDLEFATPVQSCQTLAPKQMTQDLGVAVELLK
jgi:hypothetical protein